MNIYHYSLSLSKSNAQKSTWSNNNQQISSFFFFPTLSRETDYKFNLLGKTTKEKFWMNRKANLFMKIEGPVSTQQIC